MVKGGSCFFKNKFWELEITTEYETAYFTFHVEWTRKTDYAGFRFYFELYHFSFSFMIYDSRHWDYKKNTWYK